EKPALMSRQSRVALGTSKWSHKKLVVDLTPVCGDGVISQTGQLMYIPEISERKRRVKTPSSRRPAENTLPREFPPVQGLPIDIVKLVVHIDERHSITWRWRWSNPPPKEVLRLASV
ncbi:hypothetical protein ACFL2T_05445, partial [Elusimicrobiota bacterium]